MRLVRNERGIALAIAIFALVVIGALVAGAFFVGMQEQRVGRNSIRYQQSFAAAEQGAQLQVAGWQATTYNLMTVDSSASFSGTVPSGGGWYRGQVRRLNGLLYLVRSEGFSRDSAARQQVGILVRLRPVELDVTAALKTQGAIKLFGTSDVSGNDNLPTGWTGCPAAGPAKPGVQLPDAGLITTSGSHCSGLGCVVGSPPVQSDPSITTTTLTTFGDAVFDDLRGMASKIITGGTRRIEPVVSGTTCVAGDNNWGSPLQPTGACGNYFPIVWVEGDLTINGAQGQGVLVVNGDLAVQGGFQFYGPVLVRGTLTTTGTGGHFTGGVVAANSSLEQQDVGGNAVVSYSSCAVARALQNSAPAALLAERSWVNLN